jgi:hypothetical protein
MIDEQTWNVEQSRKPSDHKNEVQRFNVRVNQQYALLTISTEVPTPLFPNVICWKKAVGSHQSYGSLFKSDALLYSIPVSSLSN